MVSAFPEIAIINDEKTDDMAAYLHVHSEECLVAHDRCFRAPVWMSHGPARRISAVTLPTFVDTVVFKLKIGYPYLSCSTLTLTGPSPVPLLLSITLDVSFVFDAPSL